MPNESDPLESERQRLGLTDAVLDRILNENLPFLLRLVSGRDRLIGDASGETGVLRSAASPCDELIGRVLMLSFRANCLVKRSGTAHTMCGNAQLQVTSDIHD